MNLEGMEIIDLVSNDSMDSTAHSADSDLEILMANNIVEEIVVIDDDVSSDASNDEMNDVFFLQEIDFTATNADIVAIDAMLNGGFGVWGHTNCILERRVSLLQNAGLGIFLRDGYVIRNGDCITQYDGDVLTPAQYRALSNHDKLYGYWVEDVIVNGLQQPIIGRGLGSFFNSAVAGRCLSFVRPVIHQDRVYFMCDVSEMYPLVGPIELYFTAGVSWRRLFHRMQQNNEL